MSSTEDRVSKLEKDVKAIQSFIGYQPAAPAEGPTKPDEGIIIHGGWGGNQSPNTWQIRNMKDKPNLFKIVDDKDINIVTDFSTKEIAQSYINYYLSQQPSPIPGPAPTPIPPSTAELDKYGIKKIVPDAPSGRFDDATTFKLDKKIRNYRSGKASEPSIEYTSEPASAITNQEFTYYVKINGFKNTTDTISSKVLGGVHSSSDPSKGTCYDVQIDIFGNVKTNMEIERPHPSMHPCHQPPQTTLGEKLVGKYIGIKVVTYLINGGKDRRIQELIDYPVPDIAHPPNNWRLLFSVDDIGQLPQGNIVKPTGPRSTCRIDGVWNGPAKSNPSVSDVSAPDFAYASVREIQPVVIATATPSKVEDGEATK